MERALMLVFVIIILSVLVPSLLFPLWVIENMANQFYPMFLLN